MSQGDVYFLSVGMAVIGTALTGLALWLGIRVWRRAGRNSFPVPASKPDDPPLMQLAQKGAELQKAGQDREAITVFEAALAQGGDATETLRILNLTADSHCRLGEYAQAQTRGLAALEIARVAGAAAEAGSTHCILGEAALKLGEWEAAAEHFNEGADHLSQAGNKEAARRALQRLTEILGRDADPESAAFYRHLASELRSSGSRLNAQDRAPTRIGVR